MGHRRAVDVTIDRVSKVFPGESGDLLALDEFSLEIAPGEFVSLLGPSGCGKSTLLLALAGLQLHSSGRIAIGGHAVEQPYTDLGIVFQEPFLLEWRTVIGNVMLQAEMRRLDTRHLAANAEALLDRVGLARFKDLLPHQLSGGMRQRTSLCRALLHDPPLLLMDEPFGAVDAITRDQLNLDLQHIWLQSRKTVIFITHSIAEAVFLSDRVMVMSPRPGRIESVIDIDLPRPRTFAMRDAPEFTAYARQIRRVFAAAGIIHDTGEARGSSIVE